MPPQPPAPAFPTPPPPEGGYGCPRCGCLHTTDATTQDGGNRMGLVYVGMNESTCNSCGYSFNTKSGKSNTPKLVALVLLPAAVIAVFFALAFTTCMR